MLCARCAWPDFGSLVLELVLEDEDEGAAFCFLLVVLVLGGVAFDGDVVCCGLLGLAAGGLWAFVFGFLAGATSAPARPSGLVSVSFIAAAASST